MLTFCNTTFMLFPFSLPKDEQLMSQSTLVCTQSQSSSQIPSKDELLSNSLILPLSQIVELDQVSFILVLHFFNPCAVGP